MTITQRIQQIRQQIPPSTRLIAVTKQVSPEVMRQAYGAGIRDFGENRLQEALPKQEQLQDLEDICWHFIGHLQTNKAKKVLDHFQWIHSVDSLKLAQTLNRLAENYPSPPQVLLQLKARRDVNKYGWYIPELLLDVPSLEQCSHLKIQGLMTILPLGLSNEQALCAFQATRNLANIINNQSSLSMPELSMGMSDDYLLAIQEGATMIRLGRILFRE